MITGTETTTGVVMASKVSKVGQQHSSSKVGSLSLNGKTYTSTKPKSQLEGGSCTHCDKAKHTREICFKLHGYPEWWNELKAKKQREAGTSDESLGKVALITAKSQLSFTQNVDFLADSMDNPGNLGQALLSSNKSNACN
jgi:hypothetical protein